MVAPVMDDVDGEPGHRPAVGQGEQRGEREAKQPEGHGLAVDPARVDRYEHEPERPLRRGQRPGGVHELQPVGHVGLQRDAHRAGHRDGPAHLSLRAPLPRRNRAGLMGDVSGAVVQPLAGGVRGLRLEPLGDRAMEFVNPRVQGADPLNDLVHREAVRRRHGRVIVALTWHNTSLLDASSRTCFGSI
jgi:hypothetical protein